MMKGIITEVQGPVVDVLFPEGQLPFIKDALTVQNGEQKCVMEVAQHMGGNIVRCIMLSPSEGLCREMEVTAEGGGIQVEPALPEPGQPDQLHFKVVVRDVLAQPDRLRRQVRTIGNAFERHADRAAEAFAGPAAGDSFTQVETHLVGSFGLPLSCRNALNTASA